MHPIFLKLGPLTIRWYGVMTALGFLVGIWYATRLAKWSGLKSEVIVDLGFVAMITGVLGGRIFYVVANWHEFAGRPLEILRVDHGGLVFYGGFIGAAVGMLTFCFHKHLPISAYADVLAPAVPLGHALGRFGCFLNGCCFGKSCDLPWAVTFPKYLPGYTEPDNYFLHFDSVFQTQLEHGLIKASDVAPLPVHPTQLYEMAGLLLLAVLLTWWFRQKTFEHRLIWVYLGLYGIMRFTIEIVRDDEPHWIANHFTNAQAVAVVMVIVAGIALLWKKDARNVG